MTIIDQIKQRIDLTQLIGETYTITGRGRIKTTAEHDSLKVWTDTQTWHWFSKKIGGDCLDWYQFIHQVDLPTAIQHLARRAGVELRPLSPEEQLARTIEQQRRQVFAIAAHHFHQILLHHPDAAGARAYCHSRGWTDETITRELIGYNLPPHSPAPVPLAQQLRAAGLIDHPAARAVLSIPHDALIYTHRHGGEVIYLSARSIGQKRHYNLPERLEQPPGSGIWLEAAGPKQLYINHPAGEDPATTNHLLVEGQADAISLGQLGIPATALCGIAPSEGDWSRISHVALDNDPAGRQNALQVALGISPTCRLITWPDPAKDANDYLLQLQAGLELPDIHEIIDQAPVALIASAAQIAREPDLERRAQKKRELYDSFLELDELIATSLKPQLREALGLGMQQLNRELNARREERKRSAEKSSPERYQNSSGGSNGGLLWEQCVVWRPDGTALSMYAIRNQNGDIEMKPMVEIGGICYVPYPATMDLIQKRVILFPERPVEYHSQKQLLAEIQGFIHKYLDIDPFYERLASYYVIFSWLYDLFQTLPYLRALGDYGTGKSRFLQTIGALCYRPMFVSGASTTSPIFRIIDMFKGTLIIDEADFASSDAEAEIIKILNVGYYRGGVVLRAEKDPNSQFDDYWPAAKDVYGPKILATRHMFADRATESRCLTKRMLPRRPRPDIPYLITETFWDEARAIRNKLLMYRLRNHRPMEIDPALADESIEPRLNQVTMALKATVDDPEMLQEIDLFVRNYNQSLITDRQMTLPAIIVQALANIHYNSKHDLYGEHRDYSMKNIYKVASEILTDIDPEAKLSPRKVGSILTEELGLTRRGDDPRTRRKIVLFEEEELQTLMNRYGISGPEDMAGSDEA